jgi:predicted MFS family arabinose efflux permease
MGKSHRTVRALPYAGVVVTMIAIAAAAGVGTPLLSLYQRVWGFPVAQLTAAFAVYAITLLLTLLVAGSLSDHVGRRPVLLVALGLMVGASLLFLWEGGIATVTLARALQGVATGAATSTFSAFVVELAQERRRQLMTVVTSAAPVGGLGVGALVGGLLVDFTADPTAAVFAVLLVVFLVGALCIVVLPETSAGDSDALRSLRPQLVVPRPAREWFIALLPLVAAGWMFSGLFLGLAPSFDREIFGLSSGSLNGLVVALQPLSAALFGLAFAQSRAAMAARTGVLLLFAGAALVLVGLAAHELAVIGAGAAVGGAGQGAGFGASLRLVGERANNSDRGGLFAAVYLVAYIGYGAPVLLAGLASGAVGLEPVVTLYAAGVVLLAAAASILTARQSAVVPHVRAPESART